MRFIILICCLLPLWSCSHIPLNRPTHDGPPAQPTNDDLSTIPDAEPKEEPLSPSGNKTPYEVLGETYSVLPKSQARGYQATGNASWYGKKFHGRRTASGESFSMFAMTGAHRQLPLPTYVKVTNLDNQKTAIIKINDRGPFDKNRLIDVSYAAAVKLGFANKGLARVKVETVTSNSSKTTAIPVQTYPVANTENTASSETESSKVAQLYLQAGAFSDPIHAAALQKKLAAATQVPVIIRDNQIHQPPLHCVQLGPIAVDQLNTLRNWLIQEMQIDHPLSVPIANGS